MSVKNKLAVITAIMMLIPAALIIILSVLLIGIFSLAGQGETISIISGVSVSNPYVIRLIIIWAVAAVAVIVVTGVCITSYIKKTVLQPIKNLSDALDRMKMGDLQCEFIGSGDEELKRLCASFEELRLQLQRNIRKSLRKENEQKMLLVNISHDIRTPITSIKGYVEGIRDGVADTPEKKDHYLRTIYMKAEAIEQMAENLSLYSKLELGKAVYNREVLDVFAQAAAAAEEFSLDLQTAGVRLSISLPSETVYIMADKEKLRRVFSNIIINAIKYKKPGNGSLEVSAELCENGVIITFSDSGIGISEKEIPHIFDGFYRGDPSRDSSVEGNGLGLSISRRIISDHGGKIWARSTVGEGTDMIILLPVWKKR